MRKLQAVALVREELEVEGEIAEEHLAAEKRCQGPVVTSALRLSFFRNYPSTSNWKDIAPGDILGYAVILFHNLPNGEAISFILEAVLTAPELVKLETTTGPRPSLTNYYIHCAKEWETTIGTSADPKAYRVFGSFFCQQNNLTHVCAQAALRVALNNSPDFQGKITNQWINQRLDIDHVGKKIGEYDGADCGGVSAGEMIPVIQAAGYDVDIVNFATNTDIEYADYIYPLVEARCPVILGIERASMYVGRGKFVKGVAHVVAVLGHTLNSDRWGPDALFGYGSFPLSFFHSSARWADHFIISDDNFGMYLTLPSDMIRNFLAPLHNPNLHAIFGMTIVPRGVSVPGYFAEQTAAAVAAKLIAGTRPSPANNWLRQLQRDEPFVCRTLLRSRADYVAIMENTRDSLGRSLTLDEVTWLRSNLPDLFWVTEITLEQLYTANKAKLGDVVSLSRCTNEELESFANVVFAWLPGITRSGPALSGHQRDWSFAGHVPIVRLSDLVPTCEW